MYFLRKDFDNCEIFIKNFFKKNSESNCNNCIFFKDKIANLSHFLNYVNYFYLDESYAKEKQE